MQDDGQSPKPINSESTIVKVNHNFDYIADIWTSELSVTRNPWVRRRTRRGSRKRSRRRRRRRRRNKRRSRRRRKEEDEEEEKVSLKGTSKHILLSHFLCLHGIRARVRKPLTGTNILPNFAEQSFVVGAICMYVMEPRLLSTALRGKSALQSCRYAGPMATPISSILVTHVRAIPWDPLRAVLRT
jgi:hypothetical protein